MNYILHGEEKYLIQKKLNEIMNDLKVSEMNTVFYDAQKVTIQEVLADCQTLPFFSEHKVVVLENCKFLGANTTLDNEELLINYVEKPLASTTLILVYADKMDGRKKLGKQLQKNMEVYHYKQLEEYDRSKLVDSYIQKHNIQIDVNAKAELMKRLSFDMSQVFQELDKLSAYEDVISVDVVTSLIMQPIEDNVFELSNAIMAKNVKRCFHCLKDFKQNNVEIIALIALVASQFRFLSQVKTLDEQGFSKQEIASTLSAHPYRVEKTLYQAHARTLYEIQSILAALANLDQQIKLGNVDKQQGFELLLLKYCL